MAEQPPQDAVFSLTCAECDAGQEILSQAEAEAAGWTEICYVPELPMANFLGLCPECRRWLEEQDRSYGARHVGACFLLVFAER